MAFEDLMARIEALWKLLREEIADLDAEKQQRILDLAEAIVGLEGEADEEART